MNQACIRFHRELNDFLPSSQKNRAFQCRFEGHPAVKHLIEALGIPHPEVHCIVVNGQDRELTYHVGDGDEIEVYPVPRNHPAPTPQSLPDGSRAAPRFVLDIHLGKLARYLRMLGFDTKYRNDYEDEQLAELAHREGRILLTRDRRLLMRSLVLDGYWVRELDPKAQLSEVLYRFDLSSLVQPFKRCIRCNTLLKPVAKSTISDRLEPLTKAHFDDFRICPSCRQIYWKGSHFERMERFIHSVLHAAC